jgi:hypothetical protein
MPDDLKWHKNGIFAFSPKVNPVGLDFSTFNGDFSTFHCHF